jgi:hypothetical protein
MPHITVLRRMRAVMADQRKPLSTAALRPSQADWSLFLATWAAVDGSPSAVRRSRSTSGRPNAT